MKKLQAEIQRAAYGDTFPAKTKARQGAGAGSYLLFALVILFLLAALALGWLILSGRLTRDAAGNPTIDWQPEQTGAAITGDILYVGDSNTVRLETHGLVPSSSIAAREGHGIASVRGAQMGTLPGGAAATAIEVAAETQPGAIVISMGTNDIGGSGPDAFIAEYTLAVQALQAASPKSRIVVNSIPPVAKTRSYPNLTPEEIARYNLALEDMCKALDVQFLNSHAVLCGMDGYIQDGYAISDGIHLSESGLAALLEVVQGTLR